MTEYMKMQHGMIYDCFDKEIGEEQARSHRICDEYNRTLTDENEKRTELLRQLFETEALKGYCIMERPIFIDNAKELKIGANFYSNIYFSYIGGCPAEIGDNVFIGPFCTLATGIHSLIAEERRITTDENGAHDYEYGRPIKIGNDVWIASNVTICGGVTVGDGSVIGAGSVVTKDIPSGVLAAGNPCRVIREITENDSMYLKNRRQ
ncbi:MAG: sugar O-acetyltransferase [Oscillospiraceae bacterium]|nr:sugar O-acetyltransferase [Oscillospiraceae bacterium]